MGFFFAFYLDWIQLQHDDMIWILKRKQKKKFKKKGNEEVFGNLFNNFCHFSTQQKALQCSIWKTGWKQQQTTKV